MAALEAVHAALKPLDAADRQRVLSSVYALLGIPNPDVGTVRDKTTGAGGESTAGAQLPRSGSSRPVGITELIQQKHPDTHPEFITLFAYYREKHQNLANFSRADLEKYYATSHQTPPKNYTRDFISAVKRGWIHEDGDNSYITTKGIEAVESGFADGGKSPRKKAVKPSKSLKKPKRTNR